MRTGDILCDENNVQKAVIIGKDARTPWTIYGEKVWIAVATAANRFSFTTWDLSNIVVPNLELTDYRPVLSCKSGACDTGKGSFVSCATEEYNMDVCCCGEINKQNSASKTESILTLYAGAEAASLATSVETSAGVFSLPRMEVLMRVYQSRTRIDELDPTVEQCPDFALSNWGFRPIRQTSKWSLFSRTKPDNELRCVWSSSVNVLYPSTMSGCIRQDGYVHFRSRWNEFGVIPCLEIPAL